MYLSGTSPGIYVPSFNLCRVLGYDNHNSWQPFSLFQVYFDVREISQLQAVYLRSWYGSIDHLWLLEFLLKCASAGTGDSALGISTWYI